MARASIHENLVDIFVYSLLFPLEIASFLQLLVQKVLVMIVLQFSHHQVVFIISLLLLELLLLLYLTNFFTLRKLFLLRSQVVVNVGFIDPLLSFGSLV